ncbi:hypothetical protein CCHR01_16200 [Colletotrichum chrysophilum]|uniref:Uncharacterized protein n=1 Tax=Colletotrichum chrysophilum TaxID=1836956 RepID=A0AAD9A4U0_9PEZI|nr:hypothetical protein CCHR01_16200 [Colletotrichum chrysophilum]
MHRCMRQRQHDIVNLRRVSSLIKTHASLANKRYPPLSRDHTSLGIQPFSFQTPKLPIAIVRLRAKPRSAGRQRAAPHPSGSSSCSIVSVSSDPKERSVNPGSPPSQIQPCRMPRIRVTHVKRAAADTSCQTRREGGGQKRDPRPGAKDFSGADFETAGVRIDPRPWKHGQELPEKLVYASSQPMRTLQIGALTVSTRRREARQHARTSPHYGKKGVETEPTQSPPLPLPPVVIENEGHSSEHSPLVTVIFEGGRAY